MSVSKHRCVLCQKEIRRGEYIIVISSPTKATSTMTPCIGYDYIDSVAGETPVHSECLDQLIPELVGLIKKKQKSEITDDDTLITINPSKSGRRQSFPLADFIDTLEATGVKISRSAAQTFVRKHPDIKDVSGMVKEWFRARTSE